MKIQIRELPRARADVRDIASYIAADNPDAALHFFDCYLEKVEQLRHFPAIGRLHRPEYRPLSNVRLVRILEFDRYLVFYRYSDDLIVVVRVLHAARDTRAALELP